MKTVSILKKIITVYYYLIAIGFCVKIIKIVNSSFRNNGLKSKIFDLEFDFSNVGTLKTLLILMIPLILYFLFFRAIHLLKYSLDDLEGGNFFTEALVRDFRNIGVLFIICALGELIGYIIVRLVLISELSFKIDSSMILFLLMGLFFMFLSEVFEKARKLEQENDLTI